MELETTNQRLVVQFDNVTFDYGRAKNDEALIRNMNMNVPHGQIYGLLGPNGCGKSTSLNLILGLLRPRQGTVKVYGVQPNRPGSPVPGPGSGYMPQDLTLIMKLTVMDHFYYFGRLAGMDDDRIRSRARELMKILEIPALERRIQALSGGQQRRVSLAVSLIHSPPLLVLDEPTVGIDPVLRDKVWLYLRQLCVQESKTVILTTHYIEECIQADTIGLMRNGKLLAESNPVKLLKSFQTTKIEDVFLQLCEAEDSEEEKSSQLVIPPVNCITGQKFIPYDQQGLRPFNFRFDRRRFWAIFLDVGKFCTTTTITLFLCTILPMVQLTFFHLSVGLPPRTLPIVITGNENAKMKFSEFIFEDLNPVIKRIHAPDPDAGIRYIEKHEAYAVLDIPENFTRCLTRRAMHGVLSSDSILNCSQVHVYIDQTNQFIVFQLWTEIWNAFRKSVERFFPLFGINPGVVNAPVNIMPLTYGKYDVFIQDFMTGGIYMSIIYLAPMIVTVFVFFEQKCLRHIIRSEACGAKIIEVLSAHFLFNILLTIPQCFLMLTTSLWFFQAQNLGSPYLLTILNFLVGISAISIALLIGSIVNDKLAIFFIVYGLITGFWLWCGIIWPVENNISILMQKIALALPLTLPAQSIRNIMNRGWNFYHPQVSIGFISIAFHIFVPFILALFLFRN